MNVQTPRRNKKPPGSAGKQQTAIAPPSAALVERAAKLENARNHFWDFCQLMGPGFFKPDRLHLKELCETLEAAIQGTLRNADGSVCRRLAISEPPRHGKSYTLSLFNMWVLGRDPAKKVIDVSYNAILSSRFARTVRDGISATAIDPAFTVFADVFPGIRIKDGDAAMDMWSLEGSYFTFLAASFGSTVTGIGCDIMVIDDPIKSSYEAYNARILEEKWDYYRDTLRSRIEKGGLLIVVMTRWATRDLVGRFLELEPDKWTVLNQPACLDEKTGEMLCPDILPYEDWLDIKNSMSKDIFLANYQNTPIDREGRLYTEFAEYEELPVGGVNIFYVDTADTGADYLCAIFGKLYEGQVYITQIIYTDEPMEKTEPLVADAIYDTNSAEGEVESNNGGRGFARNVRAQLWKRHHSRRTKIVDRNQRQNKQARILTESTYVMQNILYPAGWDRRWPGYYRAMRDYMRKGKNDHDDAPDATTGLAEYAQRGLSKRKKFASGRGARR